MCWMESRARGGAVDRAFLPSASSSSIFSLMVLLLVLTGCCQRAIMHFGWHLLRMLTASAAAWIILLSSAIFAQPQPTTPESPRNLTFNQLVFLDHFWSFGLSFENQVVIFNQGKIRAFSVDVQTVNNHEQLVLNHMIGEAKMLPSHSVPVLVLTWNPCLSPQERFVCATVWQAASVRRSSGSDAASWPTYERSAAERAASRPAPGAPPPTEAAEQPLPGTNPEQ